MAAFDALKEFMSELSQAISGEGIGRALFEIGKRYGHTSALILDATRVFDRIGPAIVFASDRDKSEAFDAVKPLSQHALAMRARASDEPFVTRWQDPEADYANLPPHLQNKDGLVVPVHDNGALAWYCGFVGPNPDLSEGAVSVMSAAAQAGYARFKELLDANGPRSPLTPREAECLRWVAQGKTDAEIGIILKISPRTVRFHVDNAKAKLGVSTRIQAVAKRVRGPD